MTLLGVTDTSAVSLTSATASAARPSKAVAPPLKGAGIKVPGRAPGPRWVGAREVDDQVGYLLDPMLRQPRKLSAPAKASAVWPAKTRQYPPERADEVTTNTARAAWVLSKYGTYRDRAQGAAVEVALTHLLQRKAWHVRGRKTKKRLAWSRQRLVVRSLARTMLRDSEKHAGPYTVTVTGDTVDAGTTTTLRANVVSAQGVAQPGLPVTFLVDGQPAGVGSTGETGDVAVAYQPAAAGAHTVTATVDKLPAHELLVRVPEGKPKKVRKTSRVAIAEAKTNATVAGRFVVVAQPRLAVSAVQVQEIQAATKRGDFIGTMTLGGVAPGGAAMDTHVTLHGPYSTHAATAVACNATDQRTAATSTGSVAAQDGTSDLPKPSFTIEGWYAVRVRVAGNEVNKPVEACGATYKAMRVVGFKATPEPTEVRWSFQPNPPHVQLSFDVTNLPAGYKGPAIVGFFHHPTGFPECEDLIRWTAVPIGGDGRYLTEPFSIPEQYSSGVSYQWTVTLPRSEFSNSIETTCGQLPVRNLS